MVKAKKKARSKVSEREAGYQTKLDTLRRYVSGFDSTKLDKFYQVRPRTESGKLAKRRKLAQLNARYRQLRPFVQRMTRRVAPRGKNIRQKIQSLREYAGLPAIKGLRAVPIEATPKARVTITRKGRVSISQGRVKETIYRFPRKPRNHWVDARTGKSLTAAQARRHRKGQKRYLTVGEDAYEMLKAMMRELPADGYYMVMTDAHMLVAEAVDKQSLLDFFSKMIHNNNRDISGGPYLLPKLRGVKRVVTDMQGLFNFQKEVENSRTEARYRRAQIIRSRHERAAFKLGKQSRRAKLKGR